MVAALAIARRRWPAFGPRLMKVLVFGQTGQVARALACSVPKGISARFLGRDQADLMQPLACAAMVQDCDIVINAAAWTAVDLAEAQEENAHIVNAAAPTAIAQACAARAIPMIHISTDYVFGGAGTAPFTLAHPTAPLGAYGRSKVAGEEGLRASGVRHVILRTSWVFSAHGANFLKTMLRLGAERESINVVSDQIGGPTPAQDIAAAIWHIAQALQTGHSGGTYHFSGAPDVCWADFARAIMQEAQLPCTVQDIPTSAYPTPARRPANSRLDCSALMRDFGIARPDWRAALPALIKEITQ
jgi:dTDP-4-dehydrorhamnose reductase